MRYAVALIAILAALTSCGLKRNLELPGGKKAQPAAQSDQAAPSAPTPATRQ